MPPLIFLTEGEDATLSESIAASLRAYAFDLTDRSPIAAAHLVLAAATLAPECDDERNVADELFFVMADFAIGLAKIDHRARQRR